jgi:hypothetical protein
VHLTPRGVDAVTAYLANVVGQVLAGRDVSPGAAPWTVLVPGAEGEAVSSVQDALIAADIELAGGADGVYGNDTMAAVAEYQRDHDLQVTGAVDLATARALGVVDDPDAAAGAVTTTSGPTTQRASPTTVPASASPGDAPAVAADGGGAPPWALAAGAAVMAMAAAVAGRRRYVVAQRASRRWARVHPATSPLRTVADMRRAGELPPPARLYDQFEELAAADTGDGPR